MKQLLALATTLLMIASFLSIPLLAAQEGDEGGGGGPVGQEGGRESEPSTPSEEEPGTQPAQTYPEAPEPGGGEEPPENTAAGGTSEIQLLVPSLTVLIILALAIFLFKKARSPKAAPSPAAHEVEPELNF